MPLASIIMQTFNRCDLVKRAIESAINQTYKNVDIIICDNHSEDGTQAMCEEFARNDDRIRYFRHEKNIGMVANGNFGLHQVKGKYYIFLNDDDWLDENYVKYSVEFLENNLDYSFCAPQSKLFKPDSDENTLLGAPDLDSDDIIERVFKYIKAQDSAKISSGCFRTSILDEIHNVEQDAHKDRYNEDIVFIIKYVLVGKGKVLTNTYYNKTDCGTTTSIETTREDIYTTKDLVPENIPIIRARSFATSILDDKFYELHFDNKQRKEIAKKIFYETIRYSYGNCHINNVIVIYFKDLIEYMIRHPNFFVRSVFYKKLDTFSAMCMPYLKIKRDYKI